ncbi:glycosyltransferase [Gottfriedia sp. NPDC056225]|uniref:glycosyltransferase n=1 Tax=Gottfriedia sp. NPDC056225 TaxID=3345751 RepID=UPI0035D6EC61
MKKIILSIYNLYNGGAERSLVNFLNEIDPQKYQVDLMLFDRSGMFLNQVPSHVNILETPVILEKLYGKKSISSILDIKGIGLYLFKLTASLISKIAAHPLTAFKAFRWHKFYKRFVPKLEGNYDVAIAYCSGDIMFYTAEKIQAEKKITWVHNDYRSAQHPKRYDEIYFGKMDKIISISDLCVDILKEEFPQYKDKFLCLPNLTSSIVLKKRAHEFIPSEFDYQYINILSIGRLNEQKGFDLALEAAYIMKKQGIKFRWYVIGNGELESLLKKSINEKNMQEDFVLLGMRDNPYPYILNCDIFAQTSRFEGKSVVIDEAKILEKPILCTNYPTVYDQIKDGSEGIIVEMTPKDISDGIYRLIEDEELGNSIKYYLEKHEYGNQKVVNNYYEMIDSV